MEDNYKTAWASYSFFQEISKYRPMGSGEESWLNKLKQADWMCGTCDETFDTEYMMRKHMTSSYKQEKCKITWAWNRKFFLHEIKGFRPLNTEENEWLRIHFPYNCNTCRSRKIQNRSQKITKNSE